MHLICFGLGYSALPVARAMLDRGWRVTGTTRSEAKAGELAAIGVTPEVFNSGQASATLSEAIRSATHVLVSIAPDLETPLDRNDPVLATFAGDLVSAPSLQWVGYLSTVGVYGDHGGGWVDEQTPLKPVSRRSIARLAAETAWHACADDAPWRLQIYRLAGIYGPGRSPIDKLKRGTARRIVKLGQVFNRIHVDDIATAVIAGIDGRGTHSVYNVTDNEPAPPQDVIAYAAERLGIEPPPEVAFENADLSPMGRSFYGENKRVANQRLREDLGVSLLHPTYRAGIAALLTAD